DLLTIPGFGSGRAQGPSASAAVGKAASNPEGGGGGASGGGGSGGLSGGGSGGSTAAAPSGPDAPAEPAHAAGASAAPAVGRDAPQAPAAVNAEPPGPVGGATAATAATVPAATPAAPSSLGDAATALPQGVGSPPVSRPRTVSLGFHEGLSDWNISVLGGSTAGKGSVSPGSAILREGDSFQVGLERSFTVVDNRAPLVFTYSDLNFDTSDPDSINDAFEASLVDSQGHTLVHTIAPGRDAFFNASEDVGVALGPEATQTGDAIKTVTLDLSGVQPNTSATIRFRLINNDQDTETSVHILDVRVPGDDPPAVSVGLE